MTGLTPSLAAALVSWTAPASEPWSVSATAGISNSAARAASAGIRQAPSRMEYSEWTCRWTNGASGTGWAILETAPEVSREARKELSRLNHRRAITQRQEVLVARNELRLLSRCEGEQVVVPRVGRADRRWFPRNGKDFPKIAHQRQEV